jgi:galactokinase
VTDERRASLSEAFRERFGGAPDGVSEAPGRVNLIGEHLDYNEGLVLPCAIDRSVLVAYALRGDATVRAHALDFSETTELALNGCIERDAAQPWSNYVRGCVFVLREAGYSGPGADLAIDGDVPIAAGLSSSAALEVATLGALRAAWGADLDNRQLALLGQRAENEFVGVQCGIMDQLASALGVAEHALLIDCRTLSCEAIPLRFEERGVELVVVDSAVPRRLEQSAYNQRREECAEAARLLGVAALRDASVADLERVELPGALDRRARHAVAELRRVEESVQALRAGDLETFGLLMNASHASLRDDFEVSCPELDRLVELAQALPGVLGARLTGAGFGGCTVNLVRADAVEEFEARVVGAYRRESGLSATMYRCRAVDGLRVWPIGG